MKCADFETNRLMGKLVRRQYEGQLRIPKYVILAGSYKNETTEEITGQGTKCADFETMIVNYKQLNPNQFVENCNHRKQQN